MTWLTKSIAVAGLHSCRSKPHFTDKELCVHISLHESIETVETVESVCSGRAKDNISPVITAASSY